MANSTDISRKLSRLKGWDPPATWQKIVTIDMHTAGEPLRVFLTGYPALYGDTVLEKRRYAINHHDNLRTSLMWEPRGHADMYGCVVTPPTHDDADFDIIFLHNEGYSTMCGHAIIAITKLAVELELVEKSVPETRVRINAPAGLITSFAEIDKTGKVSNVRFYNVPSFTVALDAEIQVPELGTVKYDLAYGGAFYAFVQAENLGLKCTSENFNQLIKAGMQIKDSVQAAVPIVHPFEKELGFLYGTIFIDKPRAGGDSRNVCIFAEGEVDRSPTGTGVSARMVIHYSRGEIAIDEPMVIESILGTKFTGSVKEETRFGPYDAIIPCVEGTAYITSRSEFFIDPDDPLKDGFIFR